MKTIFACNSYDQVSTPEILDCDEMRTFWVRWHAHTIALGRGGDGYGDVVVQWEDPNPKDRVIQVHVDTGDDKEGLWQFIGREGK